MRGMMGGQAGLLFAGMASFILMGAGQSLYGPALPVFGREMGLSLADASLVISAHWVGCFIGVAVMFVAGHLATPRRVLALMAAGAALIAAGWGWPVTLIGATVFGTGYGGSTVLFNPRFLAAFGDRGPSMLSLLNATFGIGAIAAPLVFVALGSQPGLGYGLIAGLCLLVLLGAQDAGRVAAKVEAVERLRPDVLILTFGLFGVGMEACLIGLGPAALVRAGETEATSAALLSAFFVAFLGARVVLTFAAHLIAPFRLYLIAVGGIGACMILAAVSVPDWFFVPAGAFAGMIFPGYFVEALARMGHGPRVAPVVVGAGLIGGIGAPLVLARLVETLGERGFFWCLGALGLVLLALGLLVMRRR